MVIPVFEVPVLDARQNEHRLPFHLPGSPAPLRVERLPVARRAQPGPRDPDLSDVAGIRVPGIIERGGTPAGLGLRLRGRSKRVTGLLIVPDELREAEMDPVA